MTIKDRLIELRNNNNINITDLCNILDINPIDYIKLESSDRSINVNELRKLSNYYNVSADYILCIDNQIDIDNYLKSKLSSDEINEINMIMDLMNEAEKLHNKLMI